MRGAYQTYPAYDYRVTEVLRVIDGDSVEVRADLGFRTDARPKIRLVIVDTPERKDEPRYTEARQFSAAWLGRNWFRLRLTTFGKTTFDRWLGDIYNSETGETLSSALLQAGYARYEGI